MNDPEKTQGLLPKFQVKRTDGSSETGGKHENCEFFVLDLRHDKFAAWALRTYARVCEKDFPLLAKDIREKLLPIAQITERASS